MLPLSCFHLFTDFRPSRVAFSFYRFRSSFVIRIYIHPSPESKFFDYWLCTRFALGYPHRQESQRRFPALAGPISLVRRVSFLVSGRWPQNSLNLRPMTQEQIKSMRDRV